ncbi:succinyldiaminopimelate transaminase [Saccharospirillum impatiens]|uniref:succinyldiaminopimelate transaminase n=1 Tax=Saccharospirillum impatiens TaxID=169438 RepID=UPI00048BDF4D|nr:succinyldiaminopimelate transaminase [Saccharospirillum impatiens]
MNPLMARLMPYPFEKLKQLTAGVTPADLPEVAWSIGEPKHAAPAFLSTLLHDHLGGFSQYPATNGLPALREAISQWCQRRFQLPEASLTAERNVLPVTGTREALFSVVQALFDASSSKRDVWMPNPFYQIYEGATFLAGGEPRYLPCLAETGYLPDFDALTDADWDNCQMLFLCTPGNPSGQPLSQQQLQHLIRKAIAHDVLLISDECYSELYRDEANPPPGLLGAAAAMGHTSYRHCLVFHSLSKRSNLPGLRSGFVAGDASLIAEFLRYRTYHGCAMPLPHQQVSIAAWQDETHVAANRSLYNQKYQAVHDILSDKMPVRIPEASFYLWPNLERDDTQVACEWLQKANIRVLPGQYLCRTIDGITPGYGHVRIALVAELDACIDAAERLRHLL